MTAASQPASAGAADALAEIGRATIHGLGWSVLVATMAPRSAVFAAFLGGFGGCLGKSGEDVIAVQGEEGGEGAGGYADAIRDQRTGTHEVL